MEKTKVVHYYKAIYDYLRIDLKLLYPSCLPSLQCLHKIGPMFLRSFGLKVRIQSIMDAENLGTVRFFLPQDDGQTGQTEFF